MRKLYLLFVLLWWNVSTPAQSLKIGNIGFVGTGKGYTDSRGAILAPDGNLLIVGTTNGNNNGDIPFTVHGQDNVFVTKTGKDGKIDWIKIFGGSQDDYGHAICKARKGYGVLARTLSGDGDVNGFKGTSDIWLIKLDEDGNKLWSKTYGSPYSEEPVSIAATRDGGFIMLGVSNGHGGDVPFHFGDDDKKEKDEEEKERGVAVEEEDDEHHKTPAVFLHDWFVVKVDRKGKKQWSEILGGEGDEVATGSILVADDGYYLVSSSDSRNNGCRNTFWHQAEEKTGEDYFLQKLDKHGKLLWSRSYGGSKADIVQQAILDKRDQSIVIAGYTNSGDAMVKGNHGDTDIWLVKTDKDGNFKWGKTFGGERAESNPVIAITPKGYALYAKTRFKELGKDDTWLLLFDNDGNLLSEKPIGGKDHDYTTAVLAADNGYILVGNSLSASFSDGKVSGRHGATEETFVLTIGEAGVAAIPANQAGIAGSKN